MAVIPEMSFLVKLDLHSQIFERFVNETDTDPLGVLAEIEQQNIALITSKLSGRYDTKAIFTAEGPERHYLIIKILTKLVLYDLIRRNAARKVASDYVRDWEWAMKILEKIKSGSEVPEGLPPILDDDGNSPIVMYGNNKNDLNYI